MHIFERFRREHINTKTNRPMSQRDLGILLTLPPRTAQARISGYEQGLHPIPVDVASSFVDLCLEKNFLVDGRRVSLDRFFREPDFQYKKRPCRTDTDRQLIAS